MRGSARIARAIATRWRSPPESLTPRSPTTVSYFSGSFATKSSQRAISAARRISSSRGVRAREGDVLQDRAVEEEVVLEDDAELRPVVGETHAGEVLSVHEDRARGRPVEGGDEADQRALAGAGGSDQGRRGARAAR